MVENCEEKAPPLDCQADTYQPRLNRGVVAIGAIGGAIASKMNDNGNQANHAVVANAIS